MNKAPQGNCICGKAYEYGPCSCGAVPLANINDLLKSFDAREWARQFCFIAQQLGYENKNGDPIDVGWMITWFSAALMRGYDEYRWKQVEKKVETVVTDILKDETIPVAEAVEKFANFLKSEWIPETIPETIPPSETDNPFGASTFVV